MSLVTIIIWLAMIGGVVAMGYGALMHVEGIGKAKQLAIDQPKITALTADVKTATDANATLRGDLTKLDKERQDCSASVIGYETETAAAKAGKIVAQRNAEAARTALQQDRDIAVGWALSKRPAGQTCEQTMVIIDKRLRAKAAVEYAERPPVDQPAKPDVMRVN